MAAWEGQTSIVRTLLQAGADPNARGEGGRTPLVLAVSKGLPTMAGILIEGRGGC